MDACIEKAGCAPNIMKATPAQQQELADQYKTSVATMQ